MPELADRRPEDRARGALYETHPRLNRDDGTASVILKPDDALEGSGDFARSTADGDPVGWRLGRPEVPVGRNVYVGDAPDRTYRQNAAPLGTERASFVLSQPVAEGQPPPTPGSPLLAKIPRPGRPRMKTLPAASSGYPEAGAQSPFWFAFTFSPDGRRHSELGPPAPAQGAHGQSYRLRLPDDVPDGVPHVGVWMSEPGKSRPEAPGPMRLQRVVDLEQHFLPHYDLTGPYRYQRLAPDGNETRLPRPDAPNVSRRPAAIGCRSGLWHARVEWTDDSGQSLPSPAATVNVPQDEQYSVRDDDFEIVLSAGRGRVRIARPNPPPGAKGWRALVYVAGSGGDWARVYDRVAGLGDERPFPLSQAAVETSGWSGNEEKYGRNERVILSGGGLSAANGTGVAAPESAPEEPQAIGAARPEPGTIWARTTDVLEDGSESLPSEAARLRFGAEEMPRVVFSDPANGYDNPTFVETDPGDLPLDWQIDVPGDGNARVESDELVVETVAPTTGAVSAGTDFVDLPASEDAVVEGRFVLEDPPSGALAGTVEVVLLEESAAGAVSERVLLAATEPGGYEFSRIGRAAGAAIAGAAFGWLASTVRHALRFRLAGGTKNARVRIVNVRWGRWGRSRRPPRGNPPRPPGAPPVKPPKPPAPLPPGWPQAPAPPAPRYDTVLQGPPEPAWTPETYAVPDPDRPLLSGTTEETLSFEGGFPPGWAQNASGNGALTVENAAALVGAWGLRARKTTGGSLSTAYLSRDGAVPEGAEARHSDGLYFRYRLPTWPSGGGVSFGGLADPADGRDVAWLEASTQAEQARLAITQAPYTGGNVTVSLDGVNTLVPVLSTTEVATLTITSPPTAPGTVTITLNGVSYPVEVGGVREKFTFAPTTAPSTTGTVSLTVDGVARSTTIYRGDSLSTISRRIAAVGWPGWGVTMSGNVLTFEATLPGPRSNPVFAPGSTRAAATLSVLAEGASETAAELGARIRSRAYHGWTVTGSGSSATFTAAQGGARADAAFSPGSTGVVGTMQTTSQGSVDTIEALAARIRATSFPGWTVTGSGAEVLFTATSSGVRRNASYSHGGTGATGTMETLAQGTNLGVVAKVKDASGNVYQRKILDGLSTSTVFDADVTVSGAGTDAAVVTFWGSTGGAAMLHLARFEDLDLTGVHVGRRKAGVFAETSAALTWDLFADDGRVTDRGRSYFEDHDSFGDWLFQVVGDYDPTQPTRQDLFLQDARHAALPGWKYAQGIRLRWEGVPEDVPAEPLLVTAHSADGAVKAEWGVTGGVTGSGGWRDFRLDGPDSVVVPPGCSELRFRSRDVGAGFFVAQRVASSPGEDVKRTGRYSQSGTYRATFPLGTPSLWPALRHGVGRERLEMEADWDAPAGTTVAVSWRAADPAPEGEEPAWDPYETDPADVAQKDLVQAFVAMTGTGFSTPVLHAGYPRVEYVLLRANREIATLLDPGRGELVGGAAFLTFNGWTSRRATAVRVLPSGALSRQPLPFGAVGIMRESELQVFTREAADYLERWWGEAVLVAETDRGEVLRVLLSAPPDFRPDGGTQARANGTVYHRWVAKLAPAQVVEAGVLPGR